MVEKVMAYRACTGELFDNRQDADKADAHNKLIRALEQSTHNDVCALRGPIADFLILNAKDVCAALTPIADDPKVGV